MYALVDCNNFYVSCERLFNPALKNRPVIVLSNNDGCAISRSDEAKALGIKMGAAPHLMKGLIRQHNVQMFSSNYELYGDISDRVMKTLKSFVQQMEVYSIDEAFLEMPAGAGADDFKTAVKIKNTLAQYLGMPVCIGIAPTKTLAKMANRFAKKKFAATGIYYAGNEAAIAAMLHETKAGDVWGIGPQFAELLRKKNILTAWDFVKAPEDYVRSLMHVTGLRTQKELKAVPCIALQTVAAPKKIIGSSRSFGKLVKDRHIIKEALANHLALAAMKLRKQRSVAGNIKVFIHTNPYRLQDEQYYQSVVMEMQPASSDTASIIQYAFKALELIFRDGLNYLKCGIELGKIVPESEVQLSLFDNATPGNNSAAKLMDAINRNYGKELLKLGVQGTKPVYEPRAAHLSKCCTTRREDILTIKI